MGQIIDIAARDADENPSAKGSPAPSDDALDGMLRAVSAVLKAPTLDDNVRWGLIDTIMQSSEQERQSEHRDFAI